MKNDDNVCLHSGIKISKPDVIKAALSVGKQEINERQIWNAQLEVAALQCVKEMNCDGYCLKCNTVYDKPHECENNQEIRFANAGYIFSIKINYKGIIEVCVANKSSYLDDNQARSLMLWLQEHLK